MARTVKSVPSDAYVSSFDPGTPHLKIAANSEAYASCESMDTAILKA
jgi:hypothetical protein